MIGFGFWDGSNNGFASGTDNVLNLLDFPMENLESDGFGEDLDAKFRSLGPIHCEDLQILLLHSNSSVQSEQTCHLNKEPEFDEDTSSITNRKQPAPLEPPRSPISVFSSSGSSCSGEKTTPSSGEKTISLNPPSGNFGPRKSLRTKKRSFKYKVNQQRQVAAKKQNQSLFTKKCAHCEITKTPQWRNGPMGPKTLCNACGVRYMTGRLLPEYRPAASPTFVPDLHSNLHKKVVEMRQGDLTEDI